MWKNNSAKKCLVGGNLVNCLTGRKVSEAGGTVGLTKVYPGHLAHLTTLQVQVVVKGALGTGPGLTPTLVR